MDRIKKIIYHEEEADRLQAASDEHRWEAARLIAEELDSGKTKAQLGREIGKTEAHVRYMARCGQAKLKFGPDVPPFNQVYNSPEVRGTVQSKTSLEAITAELDERIKQTADNLAAIQTLRDVALGRIFDLVLSGKITPVEALHLAEDTGVTDQLVSRSQWARSAIVRAYVAPSGN